MKLLRSLPFLAAVLAGWSGALHAVEFEKPETVSAREWWGQAGWLQTNLWTVRDEVRTDDFTNHYVIDSVFGTFEAWSDQNLMARLREIEAIQRLRDEGTVRAGKQGVVEVAANKIEVVESLAAAPVATVFDVPRGARAIVRRAGTFALGERRKGNYGGGGPLRGVVGANDRKRALAARLDVDPYSDNEVLQMELERVALIEALPDFGVGLVIPGNGLFSLLETGRESRMTDVYLASPSDLFLQNRETLLGELGVSEALEAEFLALPFTSPAQQSILVRSLAALNGADRRDVLVEMAAQTSSRRQFDYYRRCAELLAWYQENREPITALRTFRWLPVAETASGKRLLPLAVDLGGWCADCGSTLSVFADEEKGNVVLVTGRLTERARSELELRGVEVISVNR